jgi:type VI secretion system protein ImpE
MTALELFQAGKLKEAIDAQIKEVKAHAADQKGRFFLFELLAFAGELDRARRQIDAIKYDDPEAELRTRTYHQLLDAEAARRKLFTEGTSPLFLAPPPEHVALRLAAVLALTRGQQPEAAALLQQANALVPAFAGKVNNKPFALLRDADDLFGSVLEVFSQGNYYWLPLEQAETLALSPPKFPRDQLWARAQLQVRNGPTGDAFLPAVYPGSHGNADDQMRLGRLTDWKAAEGGPVLGVGAHVFLMDDDAVGLLELRAIEVDAPPGQPATPPGADAPGSP